MWKEILEYFWKNNPWHAFQNDPQHSCYLYVSYAIGTDFQWKVNLHFFDKEICARRLSSKKSIQYLLQSLALSDPVDSVVSPVGHVVQAVELAAVE